MKRVLFILSMVTFLITTLALEVDYHFESSKLVLDVTPPGSWVLDVDGTSVSFEKTAIVPWKKGRVDWVIVRSSKGNETKRVLIVGVHDEAPKIALNFPDLLGLGVYNISLKIVDDWDDTSDIRLTIKVDGKELQGKALDTFFLKDGLHTLRITATDTYGNSRSVEKTFRVSIAFPPVPEYQLKGPDSILFKNPTNVLMLYPEDVGKLKEVVALSREKGRIMRPIDEAGNLGSAFVVPPAPSNLTAVSKKIPLTSLKSNYLLLKSGSPYPVIGKVVLPENLSLVLGSGAEINLTTGQLIVKGVFMNLPEGATINGGTIMITGGARVYFENLTITSNLIIGGGKVLYLKKIKGTEDINIDGVKWAVIEDMKLSSLSCTSCYGVYLKRCSIGKLQIENVREVVVENSKIDEFGVSDFTKAYLITSTASKLTISTLSKVISLNSTINSVYLMSASTLRIRGGKLGDAKLESYSLLQLFEAERTGKVELRHSVLEER